VLIEPSTSISARHLAHPETLVIYTPLFQACGRKPYDLSVVESGAIAAGPRSEMGARYRLSATGRVPAEDQRLSLLEEIYDPVPAGDARESRRVGGASKSARAAGRWRSGWPSRSVRAAA
jgi:hypothetical protein